MSRLRLSVSQPYLGILILRVSMGTIMALHGFMKIAGGWEFIEKLGSLPPLIPNNSTVHLVAGVVATAIEIAGGVAVVLGYKTRLACALLVAVLLPAFAYHLANVTDFVSFMRNTWPLELTFVFVALFFMGTGSRKPV